MLPAGGWHLASAYTFSYIAILLRLTIYIGLKYVHAAVKVTAIRIGLEHEQNNVQGTAPVLQFFQI